MNTIVSTMSGQKNRQNKSTLLQTCTVSSSAVNKYLLDRVFCDSSSQKRFIIRTFVQKLKLEQLGKENFYFILLGGDVPVSLAI